MFRPGRIMIQELRIVGMARPGFGREPWRVDAHLLLSVTKSNCLMLA